MRWRALSSLVALVALTPACIFDLPPLAEDCTGERCAGTGPGGSDGAGGDGGNGPSGPGSGPGSGGGALAPIAALATDADEIPQAIAVAANGDLLVVGTFSGTLVDPTRGAIESRGRDAFVARLAPDGSPRWRIAATSPLDDSVFGAGVVKELADGRILAAVSLGDGDRTVVSPGGDVDVPRTTNEDGMILVLDADGNCVDIGLVDGTTTASSVRAVASSGAGYWFGGSWGKATSGGFVGRVDAADNAAWLTNIDGGGSEIVAAVVPLGGDVVAVGTDADGIFALRLNASGGGIWVSTFAASPRPEVRRAAVLADGRVAIVGTTAGTIDASPAAAIVPDGDGDGFILVLTDAGSASVSMSLGDATPAPGGSPLGAPGQAIFDGVASGSGLLVTGTFTGTLSTIGPATDHDAFAIRLDAALVPTAATRYAGASAQWGAGVALAGDGSPRVLVGTYGQVDDVSTPAGGAADLLVLPGTP